MGLIFDIHMPINTEPHDDSQCCQVFAVKQPGMDVCSIYTSKGGEAIKKMRRKREREREKKSFLSPLLWLLFFLIVLKSNKKVAVTVFFSCHSLYSSVTCQDIIRIVLWNRILSVQYFIRIERVGWVIIRMLYIYVYIYSYQQ